MVASKKSDMLFLEGSIAVEDVLGYGDGCGVSVLFEIRLLRSYKWRSVSTLDTLLLVSSCGSAPLKDEEGME